MSNNIHLIGNAHLDPVWLWHWQEGYAEIKATFRSALDRIHENHDFIFTCACAAYYAWVEENEPEMFEEIRQAVKNGQWTIVGGMWIQPDMNTPSGESVCRQLLYSQNYFMQSFGHGAVTGYNVDSFGHNAMLPQLLKKAGMNSYVWMRPSVEENPEIPEGPMIWEAPDGSRVRAYRIKFEYICRHDITAKIAKTAALGEKLNTPMMVFYGVGNHGGGPTIENLKELDAYRPDGAEGEHTFYSDPDRYFAELDGANLPVWRSELQHHASGCYSTCSNSKRLHRIAEGCLLRLEAFGVLSSLLGGLKADRQLIANAWKTLMFNEFHDIMGGCAIREAIDEAIMQLQEVQSVTAREENRLLQRIAWHVNTMKGVSKVKDGPYTALDSGKKGTPLVVFNPHEFEADWTVHLDNQYQSAVYDDGTPIPVQRIRSSRTNKKDHFDTLLQLKVPALGYVLVWALKDPVEYGVQETEVQRPVLENACLRAEFDEQSGALIHLIRKEDGTDVLKAPTHTDVIDISACDTWAHNVFRFDQKCGEFGQAQWKLTENGPVRSVLRVRTAYGSSTLEQKYILYHDARQLQVSVLLNMQQKHRMVKLAVPTIYSREIAEIPYGVIERRACGNEEHCQRFVAMQGNEGGLALLNDGRYSYSAENGTFYLTAANSSIYADHYGQAYRDESCRYMDQGELEFTYALLPYAGSWQQNDLHRAAKLLNMPLPYVWTSFHEGELPASFSALALSSTGVEMGALKHSEDGRGWVLRLVERRGEKQQLALGWNRLAPQQVQLLPFEVKTLRICSDASPMICETDLLECPQPDTARSAE